MPKIKNTINGRKPVFGDLEQIKVLQDEQRRKADKAEYAALSDGEKWDNAFIGVEMNAAFISGMIDKITAFFDGRNPMDIMIDKATGREKSYVKGFLMDLKLIYKQQVAFLKYWVRLKSRRNTDP